MDEKLPKSKYGHGRVVIALGSVMVAERYREVPEWWDLNKAAWQKNIFSSYCLHEPQPSQKYWNQAFRWGLQELLKGIKIQVIYLVPKDLIFIGCFSMPNMVLCFFMYVNSFNCQSYVKLLSPFIFSSKRSHSLPEITEGDLTRVGI